MANSADFSTDVRSGANAPVLEDGGYFEVGLFLSHLETSFEIYDESEGFHVDLLLSGEYRYKSFFVEATQGSLDGLNLGFTLWSGDKWIVDLLVASAFGSIEVGEEKKDSSDLSEEERNEAILDRDTFFNGAGIRATAYWYDYIYQFRIVKDTHGGNGVITDLKVGRGWQYRNWNFHAIFNARSGSDRFAQYWFGIDEEEATERFPETRIKSGIYYVAEVGLTYPVSENWVFRSFYRHGIMHGNLQEESPLVSGDYDSLFMSSISYVF